MNEQSVDIGTASGTAPSGMNRREAVKRGAMVSGAVGAAWAAPVVFDSFASPAAAATCPNNTSPQTQSGPGTKEVCIPAGKTVTYTIIGGGGGGGSVNTYNGGAATKITGTFIAPGTTGGPSLRLILIGAGGGSAGSVNQGGSARGGGGSSPRGRGGAPRPGRNARGGGCAWGAVAWRILFWRFPRLGAVGRGRGQKPTRGEAGRTPRRPPPGGAPPAPPPPPPGGAPRPPARPPRGHYCCKGHLSRRRPRGASGYCFRQYRR